jgi:hypothetical protein
MWWCGQRWDRATLWCGGLWLFSVSPLDSMYVIEKEELQALFRPILRIFSATFLKYKNSRKQELALWYLVNRLILENA